MPRTSNKREKLLAAARELIHQQGYRHTTLSEIAERSEVPLGNVYYYFKTKDDLAAAVIKEHLESFMAQFKRWEVDIPSPRARLNALLDYLASLKDMLAEALMKAPAQILPIGHSAQLQAVIIVVIGFRIQHRQKAVEGQAAVHGNLGRGP